MTENNAITRFFRGMLAKHTLLTRNLPIAIIVLLITTLISNLVFPTAYDWRYMVISALTNAEDNPAGYWILSSAMTLAGILLIPFPGYLQKHLGKICRFTAGIGSFFFVLGVIALILTGILYEGSGIPSRTHENLAAVAFAGLVFGCFFYGFPMMKDRIAKYGGKRQFNFRLFIIGALCLWFAFLGMALSALYVAVVPNNWGWVDIDWIEKGAPVLASFALWEWILYFMLLFYLVLLIEMIPEHVEPLTGPQSS